MTGPRESIKYLLILWLAGYTGLCYAAGTLFDEMTAFDWRSVGAAAAAGMFGGLLKTILMLASKNVLVLDVIRQCWRDLLVAMVGAVLVYGLMLIAQMSGVFAVPSVARMLILVGVGFSRGKWQSLVEAVGFAAKKKVLSSLGADPAREAGPSALTPLETKR
jgi:hypothetical protein